MEYDATLADIVRKAIEWQWEEVDDDHINTQSTIGLEFLTRGPTDLGSKVLQQFSRGFRDSLQGLREEILLQG